jgi:DhnA family fructose-bisphosphate aldolase class Ia
VLAEMGMRRRLRQLLPPDRAALWLPLDDGLISGPEAHLRDPRSLLVPEVVGHVTAVLGFRGTLTTCQRSLADVPIVMNLSASTIRHEHTRKVRLGAVTDAVRAGAHAIAYHANVSSPYEGEAIRDMSELASDAEQLGVPLVAMVYPRARQTDGSDENYLWLREQDEDDFARLVRHCVRIAAEVGASVIKTIYTGSEESFRTVVASAMGLPVLIAGEKLTEAGDAIAKGQAAIRAGAAGVAYGRQIFEREDPGPFVQKLRGALDDERFAMLSQKDSRIRV